ncbi:hypothetical protein A1353_20255 [Methylomonas methanica]|uniref:Uncharacterized protein n=1 Tax=Methylomonas methanica TaxID=421 RepID=A0A177MHN4_METMH|nr:hypothetical protein A1353_20255 [Methylomonas methanica]OAI05316.1 hypothetical protein A1332_13260 [Methylomonas methanica]
MVRPLSMLGKAAFYAQAGLAAIGGLSGAGFRLAVNKLCLFGAEGYWCIRSRYTQVILVNR